MTANDPIAAARGALRDLIGDVTSEDMRRATRLEDEQIERQRDAFPSIVAPVHRLETRLEGPVLIEPTVHGDMRGFFLESFRTSAMAELGLHDKWVQDNHSRSAHGVLRGMHFQPGMAKLVRCARGAILDVLVDIRPGSPSFGRWEGFPLDDESHHQLYVPDGFGHGFCVLSETADVLYRCSAYYDPARESGFRFDDPQVGIDWPEGIEFQTSERDRGAPLLHELNRNG